MCPSLHRKSGQQFRPNLKGEMELKLNHSSVSDNFTTLLLCFPIQRMFKGIAQAIFYIFLITNNPSKRPKPNNDLYSK